jgi:ribonuclease HI
LTKNKFYAVRIGRKPGIYTTWDGPTGAQAQVAGFAGAKHKSFETRTDAENWLKGLPVSAPAHAPAPQTHSFLPPAAASEAATPTPAEHLKAGKVVIYTDGGSKGNPGPGGFGAVILFGSTSKEFSGGFRRTTNNRMELTGPITALEALTRPSQVVLVTDSQYVAEAMTKGWAKRWRRNNWMRSKKDAAENPDLWERLLRLCEKHTVEFIWVRGHAGDANNERCDQLATAAASQPNLPPDPGFEAREPGVK